MTATRPQRKIGDRSKSSPSSENKVHLGDSWRFPYPNSHFSLHIHVISLKMPVLHVFLDMPIFPEARCVAGGTKAMNLRPKTCSIGATEMFLPWPWPKVLEDCPKPESNTTPKRKRCSQYENLRWKFLDLQFLCAMSTFPKVLVSSCLSPCTQASKSIQSNFCFVVTTTRVDLSADPYFLLDWETAWQPRPTQVIHTGRNVEAMTRFTWRDLYKSIRFTSNQSKQIAIFHQSPISRKVRLGGVLNQTTIWNDVTGSRHVFLDLYIYIYVYIIIICMYIIVMYICIIICIYNYIYMWHVYYMHSGRVRLSNKIENLFCNPAMIVMINRNNDASPSRFAHQLLDWILESTTKNHDENREQDPGSTTSQTQPRLCWSFLTRWGLTHQPWAWNIRRWCPPNQVFNIQQQSKSYLKIVRYQ